MAKLIVVRNDDDRPNQSRWQLKFTNVYLFHLTFTFNRFIVYAEERQSIVVVVSEVFLDHAIFYQLDATLLFLFE